MAETFPPRRDAALLAFTTNFSAYITANGDTVGLSAAQVTAYSASQATWSTALATAVNPATRGSATILAKSIARKGIVKLTRQLAAIVQAYPETTDVQRQAMGLNLRDTPPTPVGVPAAAPSTDVVSVIGRTLKLRLHGEGSPRRGKPAGVAGATLYTFVGDNPPADAAQWTVAMNTTRTIVEITFDQSTAAQTVWFCARWFNPTLQGGPTSDPISVNLPAAAVPPQQQGVRLAA